MTARARPDTVSPSFGPAPDILPEGDSSAWIGPAPGDSVDIGALRAVAAALRAQKPRAVTDIVPGYASLTVMYDPVTADFEAIRDEIAALMRSGRRVRAPKGRQLRVPVAYGGPYGPDLPDVCALCGLNEQAVIALHAGAVYDVRMIGFIPGFAYLAGLPESLRCPRLGAPRVRVPAGSVAIAADQAGIYPAESPGGWRIIGRTPSRLTGPLLDPPSYLNAGDTVRFVPISDTEYERLASHPLPLTTAWRNTRRRPSPLPEAP